MNREHQMLIQLMNRLHELHEANAGKQQLSAQLKRLADYTRLHFADEEKYMESIAYEQLHTHRLIHQDLLRKLDSHSADFQTTGKLSDAFFSFLKMWLAAHICGIDQKYGKKRVAKAS